MWLPEVQTPRPAIPLLLLSLLLSSAAADPSFHRGMLADSIAREVMMQQGEEGMSPADVEVEELGVLESPVAAGGQRANHHQAVARYLLDKKVNEQKRLVALSKIPTAEIYPSDPFDGHFVSARQQQYQRPSSSAASSSSSSSIVDFRRTSRSNSAAIRDYGRVIKRNGAATSAEEASSSLEEEDGGLSSAMARAPRWLRVLIARERERQRRERRERQLQQLRRQGQRHQEDRARPRRVARNSDRAARSSSSEMAEGFFGNAAQPQVLHKYSEVTLPGDFRIMRKKDGSEAVVAAMSTTV